MHVATAPLAPLLRPVDLRRRLLALVSLCALLLWLLASAVSLWQAVQRIRLQLPRTGATVQRLLGDELARRDTAFNRELSRLDFSRLQSLAELVPFCARVEDVYRRPLGERCFVSDDTGTRPGWGWRDPLAGLLADALGPEAIFHASIDTLPGVKVGELTVTPAFQQEAQTLGAQLAVLLAVTAGVLGINGLIFLVVGRALAPSRTVLHTLARLQEGDLSVRMPPFALRELQHIGEGVNHLAERLQVTQAEQRRLAQRLMAVREDERRHLARELHDDFAQGLAGIRLEAAFVGTLARDMALPELLPSAEAIHRSTAHLMDTLQSLLGRLRPVGLDEFGLATSLQRMVDDWRQRSRGSCDWTLRCTGPLDTLPDDLGVSAYRIVQESLTNAVKHGAARHVQVHVACSDEAVSLRIQDDGRQAVDAAVQPPGRSGHGLLGLHERVQALGGQVHIDQDAQGHRLSVWLPRVPASP